MNRVLLIDDYPEVVCALALGLEYAGFAVSTAGSVREAAVQLRNHRFDVVICDLLLPEMNGIEFWKKMSREMALPPFIFCSGMAMEPIEPLFPAGIAGFLAKPFAVSDLVAMMNSVLRDHGNELRFS